MQEYTAEQQIGITEETVDLQGIRTATTCRLLCSETGSKVDIGRIAATEDGRVLCSGARNETTSQVSWGREHTDT